MGVPGFNGARPQGLRMRIGWTLDGTETFVPFRESAGTS